MKRSFYPLIEGFRGVAVLMVLISHWIVIQYFPKFIFLNLGFLGVNFFFVLSGFLITEILLIEIYNKEKPLSIIKNFFAKRTLRIFPIYYLTIILLAVFNVGKSIELLPWNLTYALNIGANWFGAYDKIFMHIWSLCVEEQFYLIWPFLLLMLKNNRNLHVIIGFILISIIFKFIIYTLHINNFEGVIHSNLIASMDALAMGGFLAYIKRHREKVWARFLMIPNYTILILLFVFWGISFFSEQIPLVYYVFMRFISAITASIIIVKAIKGNKGKLTKVLSLRSLKYVGKISYGIYLYHWIISTLLYGTFYKIWDSINFESFGFFSIIKYHRYIGSFTLFFIITLLLATISYYIIEKPLLKLKRYF